ncbi:MAG: hypothetical protein D6812_14865 [Deltaproteobacteria bacterium]|nr:MAG: hypothetical protein D6812_14865 [Deltaproteobacteria bacterium]
MQQRIFGCTWFTVLAFPLLLLGLTAQAAADTLIEDFEEAFPAWESGWFGTNTNAMNYYGQGQGRGNNPDGLWIDDGDGVRGNDVVEIVFSDDLAPTIVSFNIDIATYIDGMTLQVFDAEGQKVLEEGVVRTNGAYSDPGVYDHHGISEIAGLSKFVFVTTGPQIEGNTSIDNVKVETCGGPNADGDNLPDACDNCPNDPNDDQSDQDLDGLGDACDCAPQDNTEPGEDGTCISCGIPVPATVTGRDAPRGGGVVLSLSLLFGTLLLIRRRR